MNNLHLKKRYKILIGIIILISLLLFSVPRVARWYIVKHSPELIGRNLAIDKIRLNYFTGTLRINNLKLFELHSDSVFVSFKELRLNLDYLPLFRNEIFVKYIILDDPYAQVLQNGDKFNFTDMMKADTTKTLADTVPSKPLKYIINNITISSGYVKYTDEILNHSISMNRVDLNIPGFTWNSDSTRLGVDFRFVDGGRLFSSLALNQADSTYTVNLKLDSLNLDIIEPYAQSYMYISSLHGYLSNDIHITGDMRSIMRLTVKGMNRVFGFSMLDTLKQKIFSFDELTMDIDTLLLEKNRLKVSSINIRKPFILFEMVDSTNNWLTLMKPTAEAPADTLAAGDSSKVQDESSFSFSKLEISDGTISIKDKTLRYPFVYSIDKILMTSAPDVKMADWIDVSLSSELNGTGQLKASFAFNPYSTSDMDIAMSISQFRMKDMDAYFRHYFGFPVTSGRMTFATQNKLRANSLVSTNSIYFRKFALGKKNGDKTEYNIPLRLALGVMSDKDGIIDLKAPVEMEGENVKVGNVRKIVFRAIGNLFVKAALSPVNMIGGLFKTDPEKLKEIHLLLTDPSPDAKNMESVDVLADILNKKPGLNLDIVYCLSPERASDTLAHMLALEEYLKENKTNSSVPDSTLARYLTGKLAADSSLAASGIGALCRRFIGGEKLNARIDSIKISHTTFLQDYLGRDKSVPADRFRIITVMPDSIKYEEPVPSFRVYFTAGDEK